MSFLNPLNSTYQSFLVRDSKAQVFFEISIVLERILSELQELLDVRYEFLVYYLLEEFEVGNMFIYIA